MGLIDLKTNLKSLTYSINGNRGPYIVKSIPLTQTSTIGYSSQYPFKGQGFWTALEDDQKRIAAWFSENRGAWAAKQTTLELFNPKTESSPITRIPDLIGANSIASTISSPLGIYIEKNGILGTMSDQEKYEYRVRQNNETDKNRLVELTNRFIYQKPQTFSFLGPGANLANNLVDTFSGGPNPNSPVLFSYIGGPGGPLTIVKKASNHNGTFGLPNYKDNLYYIGDNQETDILKTYEGQKDTDLININQKERKNIFPSVFGIKTTSKLTPRTRVEYNNQTENPNSDLINLISLDQDKTSEEIYGIRDMIKFRFGIINNTVPSQIEYLQFRAYLTGIQDLFNASIDSVKYVGRGEEFYNYTGFNRIVSFNLSYAALTRQELIPLYEKINYLSSLTAPDYSNNGYIRGNIVKLTIGDYIDNQPGIIEGITHNIDDNVPWEINLEGKDDIGQFPHILKAQIRLRLIHNGLPKKGYKFIGVDGKYDSFRQKELPFEIKLKEAKYIDNPTPPGKIKYDLPNILPPIDQSAPLGSEGIRIFNIP